MTMEAAKYVRKLQQAIAWARASSQAATDAITAQEEGLNGKAAALFKQAWEAGYQQPENAFNAAQLFGERLSQPTTAGKLLREILAKSADPDVAGRAQTELSKLQATYRENPPIAPSAPTPPSI